MKDQLVAVLVGGRVRTERMLGLDTLTNYHRTQLLSL
jgi:hypothetical protein